MIYASKYFVTLKVFYHLMYTLQSIILNIVLIIVIKLIAITKYNFVTFDNIFPMKSLLNL